uniref:Putative secreted protein n=1 Tax=Ixodes scapularis TaxID=6945 RepID=A0A4D5RCB0_IXOSC
MAFLHQTPLLCGVLCFCSHAFAHAASCIAIHKQRNMITVFVSYTNYSQLNGVHYKKSTNDSSLLVN